MDKNTASKESILQNCQDFEVFKSLVKRHFRYRNNIHPNTFVSAKFLMTEKALQQGGKQTKDTHTHRVGEKD